MKLPIRSELLIRHEVSITGTKNTYKKDLEILFIRRNRNELGLIPPLIPSFTLVQSGIREFDLQVGLHPDRPGVQVQETTAGLDQAGSG